MLDPLNLVVDLLCVYRITRLVVKDSLLNEVRWWILRRWPSAMTEFPDAIVRTTETGNELSETGLAVFRSSKDDDDGDPLWLPVKTYKWTELLECPFCSSVWLSFAVMAVNPWQGWTFYFLSSLGIAGGVALIFSKLDTE